MWWSAGMKQQSIFLTFPEVRRHWWRIWRTWDKDISGENREESGRVLKVKFLLWYLLQSMPAVSFARAKLCLKQPWRGKGWKKRDKLLVLSVRNGTKKKKSSNSYTTRRNKEDGDQIVLFLFMNAARLLCQKLHFIFVYTVTNNNKLLQRLLAQAHSTMPCIL